MASSPVVAASDNGDGDSSGSGYDEHLPASQVSKALAALTPLTERPILKAVVHEAQNSGAIGVEVCRSGPAFLSGLHGAKTSHTTACKRQLMG